MNPKIRNQYLTALQKELEPNIVKHCLAVEACMGAIYDYLSPPNSSKDEWLLAGLLHDIDYGPQTKSQHLKQTRQVLAKYNLKISKPVYQIILAHGPQISGVKPKSLAQWAIFCADSLTGLIVAVALVQPSRKLADVKLNSILKRFYKQPRFAAGCRRQQVAQCAWSNGLNIPVDKFIQICLRAMQAIAPQLEL